MGGGRVLKADHKNLTPLTLIMYIYTLKFCEIIFPHFNMANLPNKKLTVIWRETCGIHNFSISIAKSRVSPKHLKRRGIITFPPYFKKKHMWLMQAYTVIITLRRKNAVLLYRIYNRNSVIYLMCINTIIAILYTE